MIEKQIQELSLLTGPDYAARRNAFLDQAPPLPDYPHDLMARGPEYRAQYLILQGWQRNAALLGEIGYRGRIRRDSGTTPPRIGYVPQRLTFDRAMPLTVDEFLAMGFQRKPLWFGVRADLRRRAQEYLAMVKAAHLAGRQLGALSGGELQRVLLALALSQEPDLLLLDEPSAGVDFQGELIFCELLDHLRRDRGFTQLMVSHDLATVTHHADHVICLNRRVAAEGPPRQTLTAENLTAIFGVHMGLVNSRSMPDNRTACTAPCCQGNQDG